MRRRGESRYTSYIVKSKVVNMIILASAALAIGCAGPTSSPSKIETVFTVDTTSRKPISKYIYGANTNEWDKMGVPFTLARQGGNRMTAYNWETNASNAGNDWHHQNDGYLGKTDEPGWTARTFMEAAQNHGAAVILTVPTEGYVAADKKEDGDVNQTPDYLNVRFLKSYAKKPGGNLVYPPDTKDKAVYQDEFVHWIEKVKSPKTPVWFMLDNEPDIWHDTHARIMTHKVTYAEIIANNIDFGRAIKAVAPKSLVFGPANYGWEGFRHFQGAPDNGGRDFLDVYLDAMKGAEKDYGRRILDVLDVHWYPEAQGGGVRITTNDDKPGTADARIQASRSLWDPSYVEASWITQTLGQKPIALLPGLMRQIETHYPGTKLSISEYNYGGAKVISGAIAEADVLGCFGRYGVFAACNWGVGPNDTAQMTGFKSFIDFDGKGSRFGDLGLSVAGESPASNSVYAALDSQNPHRLTIVAINKTKEPMSMRFSLKGFSATSVKAYAVTSDSLAAPKLTDASVGGGSVSVQGAPESVTTLEITG